MGAIAVQAAVGEAGGKAVTKLNNFSFNAMAVINGFPLATGQDGLFLLNSGNTDNGKQITATVTFPSSDFGIHNSKWLRFLYIGIETSAQFSVTVTVDDQAVGRTYTVTPKKAGLQQIRVPLGRMGQQGRYLKIAISSTAWFRIDSVEALPVIRPSGI